MAYTSAASSIVASHTSGDEALIRTGHHGAVLQVTAERDPGHLDRVVRPLPAVTDPMNGLSL